VGPQHVSVGPQHANRGKDCGIQTAWVVKILVLAVRGTDALCPKELCEPSCAGPVKMLGRAPVWLKRPFAASFGFGGRLVSALNEKRTLASGEKVDTAHIEVKQARWLLPLAEGFQRALLQRSVNVPMRAPFLDYSLQCKGHFRSQLIDL